MYFKMKKEEVALKKKKIKFKKWKYLEHTLA